MARIVATGTWLYDGVRPTPVVVVRLDHDFWFAIGAANGDLDDDERPMLGDGGCLYYVRHRPGWSERLPFWPDSPGYTSLVAARAAAEDQVPGPVTWS